MTITATLWNPANTDFSSLPVKSGSNVLYVVDGQTKASTTLVNSNGETYMGPGVEWGTPRASDITVNSWSKDKTSQSGTLDKNGILITQQAVCFGGISNVYAADIEERRMTGEYYWTNTAMSETTLTTVTISGINIPREERIGGRVIPFPLDASLATLKADIVSKKIAEFKEPFKDSCRIHFFTEGNFIDPLVTANDSTRDHARFSDVAYATGVFWLNREDPQFRGGTAPDVQFYVDGMKIRTFNSSGVLSTTKTYSNNPAAVLLDYLTSTKYGMGLADSDLDLNSFYQAYRICEQVVVTSVPIEGAYWQFKGQTRSVKLYECNLVIDTSKSVLDNVRAILATMNDANMTWSSGQYKLILAYPNIWGKSGTADKF